LESSFEGLQIEKECQNRSRYWSNNHVETGYLIWVKGLMDLYQFLIDMHPFFKNKFRGSVDLIEELWLAVDAWSAYIYNSKRIKYIA